MALPLQTWHFCHHSGTFTANVALSSPFPAFSLQYGTFITILALSPQMWHFHHPPALSLQYGTFITFLVS
jgi:hypothetical protein